MSRSRPGEIGPEDEIEIMMELGRIEEKRRKQNRTEQNRRDRMYDICVCMCV